MAQQRSLALGCALVVGGAGVLGGCSWFGDDEVPTESVSVFDASVGECFLAPETISAELTDLARVDCAQPHHQEAYAALDYVSPDGSEPPGYPGEAALKAFADGVCAEAFGDYVGVDYRDSALFFTYLMPSPRGWEQGEDQQVLCFVTTTGEQTTGSVRDSGR